MKRQFILWYLCRFCLIVNELHRNAHFHIIAVSPEYRIDKLGIEIVPVYLDADGDMVIIQNPTLAPAMEKSSYEPKAQEADNSVDADTVNDTTALSPPW